MKLHLIKKISDIWIRTASWKQTNKKTKTQKKKKKIQTKKKTVSSLRSNASNVVIYLWLSMEMLTLPNVSVDSTFARIRTVVQTRLKEREQKHDAVTNEKQRKLNCPITKCFLKTDKSWSDYKALIKIGLSPTLTGRAVL